MHIDVHIAWTTSLMHIIRCNRGEMASLYAYITEKMQWCDAVRCRIHDFDQRIIPMRVMQFAKLYLQVFSSSRLWDNETCAGSDKSRCKCQKNGRSVTPWPSTMACSIITQASVRAVHNLAVRRGSLY